MFGLLLALCLVAFLEKHPVVLYDVLIKRYRLRIIVADIRSFTCIKAPAAMYQLINGGSFGHIFLPTNVTEVLSMLNKEKIQRINELAAKAKKEGLSLKEQKEQRDLREEYIKNIRRSFKNQLKSIKVVDEEGNDVTPEKLKREKRKPPFIH
ncbi:Uncharacterized protein YnzC, UPF0291/DUF896 family [Evansella caseinilytica]|uniref:UPF0291 protein SAMN05421736_10318 n=1 Tax=Evansella caseinilytica TaxID=1503961 RepID=A0A1H3LUX2_9BACI|nr:Uncharacterized protein YnzC, UPF0291/DUF896 family [Evansella caseinilytica]